MSFQEHWISERRERLAAERKAKGIVAVEKHKRELEALLAGHKEPVYLRRVRSAIREAEAACAYIETGMATLESLKAGDRRG